MATGLCNSRNFRQRSVTGHFFDVCLILQMELNTKENSRPDKMKLEETQRGDIIVKVSSLSVFGDYPCFDED